MRTNNPDMELEFPGNASEERLLARAFELLESEKMDAQLRLHGIRREALPMRAEHFSRYRNWRWAAAAALLLLLLAAVIFWSRSKSAPADPQLFADVQLSAVAADYNPALRSGDRNSALETAKNAFSSADWQAADRAFDLALAETPATETAVLEQIYFYKGLIRLELNDFSAAAAQFSKSLETGAGNFEKDARWLRGLAFVKSGNPQAAIPDLQKTAAESGWKKAEAARQLLEKLEATK